MKGSGKVGRITAKPGSEPSKRGRPALTPEAQENKMISLAMNLAEQQLMDGTASSQVITHFLKLGTTKEQLELEKLKKENRLLEAKAEAINSMKRTEELYKAAMAQMKIYSGSDGGPDDE